jgi:hypothetical protein
MQVSGQLDAPGRFTPKEKPQVPNGYETRWVPEPISTLWTREISLFLPGPEPRFVDRLVCILVANLRITEDIIRSCSI